MAGITIAGVWLEDAAMLPVILGALGLAALSLIDDIRGLPVGVRLVTHFVAAASCLFALGASGWVLLAVSFAVVWTANLYNFMDGADGLAGGMAVLGFGALAVAAWLGGASDLAAFCGGIAAAAFGFLCFNFPPARLFMGDSGSVPLGFAAAALSYVGWARALWHWWYPVLIFSPFVVDATVTLFKRILQREKIWAPHKDHYYQRLIRMGWGHRKTALAEYGLMIFVGSLATIALTTSAFAQSMFLFVVAVFYLVLASLIDLRWAKHMANIRELR